MSQVLWEPNAGAQAAFLTASAREVLYGGAVGGGKSDALLMLPLYRAYHPKHKGILLRRERKRLQEVIDRSKDLYPQIIKGAQWHETELRWKWPAGGSLHMGYAEHERDIENYKSFEFDLVEFDELTEFTEYQYTFMMSRNRGKTTDMPLHIRAGTNPGGEGMAWVFRRFIENRTPYKMYQHRVQVEGMQDLFISRQYIPSTVFDNPKLPDRDAYIAGLAALDPETREAMLYGRWNAFRGQFFPKAPRVVEPGYKTDKYGDWFVVRCMDYGWGDPTCILWLVVYPDANVVEIAHELYGPQMSTDSIAQMVKTIEEDLKLGTGKIVDSVLSPDAFIAKGEQGIAIATTLGEKGVWFRKANNDRVNGWAAVLNLIGRDALRVWAGRAPHLMRTILTLPRDPLKSTDVKKSNVEDHAAEALRYGCMALSAISADGFPKDDTKRIIHPNDIDLEYDKLVEHLVAGGNRSFVDGLGSGW